MPLLGGMPHIPSQDSDSSDSDTDDESGDSGDATTVENLTVPASGNSTDMPASEPNEVVADTGGFRFQNQDRRRIRNGTATTQSATKKPTTGTSAKTHRIQASVSNSNKARTVYVGNVAKGTTTDDIRAHLADVRINEVSDVVSLSAQSSSYASFCVTVDNQAAEDAIFQSSSWPADVKVRSYVSRKKQNYTPKTNQQQSNTPRSSQGAKHRAFRVNSARSDADTSHKRRNTGGGRTFHHRDQQNRTYYHRDQPSHTPYHGAQQSRTPYHHDSHTVSHGGNHTTSSCCHNAHQHVAADHHNDYYGHRFSAIGGRRY